MEIKIKEGARPQNRRPIPAHGETYEKLCQLVDKLVAEGKVEDAQPSPWCSPFFGVPKNNGEVRGVVDFRSLNDATETDSYPLPRIEDVLVRKEKKES